MKQEFTTLLGYDCVGRKSRSPKVEWQPHAAQTNKSFEWWYVTAIVHDASGAQYFLVWLPTHFGGEKHLRAIKNVIQEVPTGHRLFIICSALSNYSTGFHAANSEIVVVKEEQLWSAESNSLRLWGASSIGSDWSYDGSTLILSAKMPSYSFDLTMYGGDRIMWAKDKLGTEGFIQEGAEGDVSFYYSLPRLVVAGALSYRDKHGGVHNVDVSGFGWVDRQWGDFQTTWWEWSSWRFASGARLNLYSFPNNAHQVVSYQAADGNTQWLDGVVIKQNGYLKTHGGVWVSWGWSYELPVDVEGSRRFTVVPLSRSDTMHSGPVQFFEGAGRLIDDSTGKQVGMAVNESMDIRVLGTGPYGPHQL